MASKMAVTVVATLVPFAAHRAAATWPLLAWQPPHGVLYASPPTSTCTSSSSTSSGPEAPPFCADEEQRCASGEMNEQDSFPSSSSTATPGTSGTSSSEGFDPQRPDRNFPPPTPAPSSEPPDPGPSWESLSTSWLLHGWQWVLGALWTWCGTPCWRIGAAARAAGYAAVSGLTVLTFYGLFLVWTCVVYPTLRVGWLASRYLLGRATWEGLTEADSTSPTPQWCGPDAPRGWTAKYVQKEVRGRGADRRLPHDLLVCIDGAYARLRHGPLTGRTNRHGYLCSFDEVVGCSSRTLRRRLEADPLQVHLCSRTRAETPESLWSMSPAALPCPGWQPTICRRWPGKVRGAGCGRSLRGLSALRCPKPAHTCLVRSGGSPRIEPSWTPESETDTDTEERPCQANLVAITSSRGAIVPLS